MRFMNLDRNLLRHLPVVRAVAHRQSFSGAARELGMTASAVSHAVRAVERAVGLPLFARTTRSVALTEAGRALVAELDAALVGIERQVESLRNAETGVRGTLRLNTPRVALAWVVVPLVAAVRKRYPGLGVEVFADDALSDIVASGYDAGIRLGQMVHADMVAVRLTPPIPVGLVASRSYAQERRLPETLLDFEGHVTISYRLASGGIYRWELEEAGEDRVVDLDYDLVTNDYIHGIDLIRAGVGIGYAFLPLVRAELDRGELVRVLPEFDIEEPGLFLYFPRRSRGSPKLRALVDVAVELRAQG